MNGQNFLENVLLQRKAENEEIELLVFGRGYGECILIKYSKDEYALVDCFKNPVTNNPIVIDYFNAINELPEKINIIVVTHWHKDHISGISDVIPLANSNVKIVLNPIVKENDFNKFIFLNGSSTNEFRKIYEYIKQHPQSLCYSGQNKQLCKTKCSYINTLSPQDFEIFSYIDNLNRKLITNKVYYDIPDNNCLSIVLLFRYKKQGILLGSDMVNNSDTNLGWNGIINNYTDIKSNIFKIPHHGSITGHNDKIWTNLLQDCPTSILTTFNKGSKLPTDEDIQRIKNLSEKLYIIGSNTKKDKNKERLAKKVLKDVSIKAVTQEIGLVRYRYNLKTQKCSIECFGKTETL